MKKKIQTLCMAALLTLTITGQCFAVTALFTDLDSINAKDKILSLQKRGYVKGVGDGKFAPNETITGAESIQLIVNAYKLNIDNIRFIKEPKASDYFTKADDRAWYAGALIIASLNGLDLKADMDIDQGWTREEFTYHLVLGMESSGKLPKIKIIPANIVDGEQINVNYSGAIQRALIYHVVTLDAKGNFSPNAQITRAEAAEQVYNALEYLKAHSPRR